MADVKRPVAVWDSLSGFLGKHKLLGIRFLLTSAILLAVTTLLAALFSPVPAIGSPSGIFLLSSSTLLLLTLLAVAIVSQRMIKNLSRSLTEVESQVREQQEANRVLNRRVALKDGTIKKQSQQLALREADLKEKKRALSDVRRQSKEEAQAKSEFLSMINHEIRTPMNAIIGVTNLLIRETPREDQLEQLEILDFSAKSLLSLITDVLDYSRIESGEYPPNELPFHLENLINEVVEDYRFTADKNNISLYTNIHRDIPEKIIGDPGHLTQILGNLFSNALKFTREGRVGISAKPLPAGDHHRLLFSIADTGVGISRENHDRIFDEFTQEQSGSSRLFGGAGLGLTISKKLVELNGGKIYLESEKELGSTFYVELPYKNSEDLTKNESLTTSSQKSTPATILLVEDNPVNQTIMRRFLDKWQHTVVLAEDGEQALQKISEAEVDLVLMDLQMPNMDGYECTRFIRGLDDRHKASVPIIALTASSLQEVKKDVHDAGMNDCLTKPFNPEVLQRTLEQYTRNRR